MEIVCMDSMQLYRELDIGVAAPSAEEREAAPHHLFGVVPVSERMTCVRYAELAGQAVAEILDRGKIPLLVGGTGLYMRTLFEGADKLPETPPVLRTRLNRMVEKKGQEHLVRLLRRLDPKAADRLHPNDRQRVQRFLEVRLLTGRSILDLWAEQAAAARRPAAAFALDVPRPLLHQRIAKRVEAMLAAGWVDEVRRLRAAGLADAVREAAPIGYQLILDALESGEPVPTEAITIATRQYAKRQMTWFRKVSFIQWVSQEDDSGYNREAIINCINDSVPIKSQKFDVSILNTRS